MPLGLGLVGAGRFGASCSTPSPTSPTSTLRGVADRDHAAATELAKRHDATAYDVDDLLADPDVDVVVIATPPGDPRSTAVAALEAGKHVFCEKPLATTAEDGSPRWSTPPGRSDRRRWWSTTCCGTTRCCVRSTPAGAPDRPPTPLPVRERRQRRGPPRRPLVLGRALQRRHPGRARRALLRRRRDAPPPAGDRGAGHQRPAPRQPGRRPDRMGHRRPPTTARTCSRRTPTRSPTRTAASAS